MIEVQDLHAGYGGPPVLKGVSVQATGGALIALVGPNGCGKSTFIKTLAGILQPAQGSILIDGQNISQLPPRKRAKTISYLSQTRLAAPGMSVLDVVTLGRAPHRGRLGALSEAGQAAIHRAIEQTDCGQFQDRMFLTLSGGQQARILLARALAVEAPILLTDEPIAALDPFYQLSMMNQLKAVARSGKLVVAALHDLALAHQFADRVWVMDQGQLVSDDAPNKALGDDIIGAVFGIALPEGGFQPLRLKGTKAP